MCLDADDVLAVKDFRRAVKDAVVEINLYHRIGRSDLRRDGQGLGLRRRELLTIVTEADVIVGDRRTFATEDNEQLRTQHSRVRREGALEMLPLAGEGWLVGAEIVADHLSRLRKLAAPDGEVPVCSLCPDPDFIGDARVDFEGGTAQCAIPALYRRPRGKRCIIVAAVGSRRVPDDLVNAHMINAPRFRQPVLETGIFDDVDHVLCGSGRAKCKADSGSQIQKPSLPRIRHSKDLQILVRSNWQTAPTVLAAQYR